MSGEESELDMKALGYSASFFGCLIVVGLAVPIWAVCLLAAVCNTSVMDDDLEDPCAL